MRNPRPILFLWSLSLCLSLSAWVGEDSLRSWELGFQVGLDQVKEENLHAKVHGGISTGIGYSWNSLKKQHTTFEAALQFGRPKTAYESLAATVHVKLDLRFARTYSTYNSEKLEMRTGPFTQLAYDLNYYPNWDDSHLYWADHLDLGVRHQASWQLGERRSLSASGTLALLSVVWRPEEERLYKIDDLSAGGIMRNLHSNSTFGSLDRSVDLGLEFSYRFPISDRLAQKVRYSYQYRRVSGGTADLFRSSGHWIGLQWEIL